MSSPKILFVSCSVGMGHVRAAQALLDCVWANHPDIDARHIDLVDFLSPLAKNFYFSSYAVMARRAPKLWGAFYRTTGTKTGARIFNELTKLNKEIGSDKFLNYVQDYNPDYILSTHFTPADLIANHAQNYHFSARTGILVTDFSAHELHYISPDIDYFTPTETVRAQIIKHHVNPGHVFNCGMPINPSFYQEKSPEQLKQKYQIDDHNKTLLFLSGGDGFVKIDQLIKAVFTIKSPLNIVMIAGKNEKLLAKLKKINPPANIKLTAVGWTDNIDEYMRVADLIITKPGGLTIAECMALKKPMILVEPMPGQEEDNIKFLRKNHYGLALDDDYELPTAITKLLTTHYFKTPPTQPPATELIISKILKNLAG